MHQHIKDESEDLFSYEALNQALVRENPKGNKTIRCDEYTARKNREGFITLIADRSMSEACEEGKIFSQCGLKFHISLPENDRERYAQGWQIVKNIFIQEGIVFFKIAHENSRMSESKLSGEEEGSQRGKDVTIYADCNSEFNAQDWLRIIKRVTIELALAGIPPGYATIKEGGRADEPMEANPYCSYRYEKRKPEVDLIARAIEGIDWEIESFNLHNLPWITESSSYESEEEKEESLPVAFKEKKEDEGEKEEKNNQKEVKGKKGCCLMG